jgi:hypothetical protein
LPVKFIAETLTKMINSSVLKGVATQRLLDQNVPQDSVPVMLGEEPKMFVSTDQNIIYFIMSNYDVSQNYDYDGNTHHNHKQ